MRGSLQGPHVPYLWRGGGPAGTKEGDFAALMDADRVADKLAAGVRASVICLIEGCVTAGLTAQLIIMKTSCVAGMGRQRLPSWRWAARAGCRAAAPRRPGSWRTCASACTARSATRAGRRTA